MGGEDHDDIFIKSGPIHHTNSDWSKLYYLIAVMSCLVKGVYTMERDRQNNRDGTPDSRAEAWWKFFHFSLHTTFVDESDGSIRAAIFEYNHKDINHLGMHPHYVVAFRGTMLEPSTWLRDVIFDIGCLSNLLRGETMNNIISEIKTMVSNYDNKAIWLAGHSLGASMALYAGKIMARSGHPLEAYLFNPATALISLKLLKLNTLKFVVGVAGNITKAALVNLAHHDKGEEAESFTKLAAWKPYLFVHPTDLVCSEYINYFKARNIMSEIGLPMNISTRFTNKSMFFRTGGGESSSSLQPLHILPSAYLITSTTIFPKPPKDHGILRHLWERMKFERLFKAHALSQWWDPDSVVESELFQVEDSTSVEN